MYESWVRSGENVTGERQYLAAHHPVDRPVVLDTPHALRVSSCAGPRTDCVRDRLYCPTRRHSIALTLVKSFTGTRGAFL